MKKEKKKSGVAANVILAVFFYIMGVLLTVFNIKDLITPTNDIMDIIEEEGGVSDGQYVTVGVDAVLGWYAETKHTVNYIPVGKEQHCIVWLDDGTFISMTVKKSACDEVDPIIDDTWDYVDDESGTVQLPTPKVFKGRIRKLDSEERNYYSDAISEIGISRANNTVYDFTIDTTKTKTKQWLWIAVCVLLGTLFVIMAVRTGKKFKAENSGGYGSGSNGSDPYMNVYNNYTGQGDAGSTYSDNYTGQTGGEYRDPYSEPYQGQNNDTQ